MRPAPQRLLVAAWDRNAYQVVNDPMAVRKLGVAKLATLRATLRRWVTRLPAPTRPTPRLRQFHRRIEAVYLGARPRRAAVGPDFLQTTANLQAACARTDPRPCVPCGPA